VLFIVNVAPALGQTGGTMDTKTGLRVGGTFMTIGGEDAPNDVDRRTGLMVGGFAVFNIPGPFAFQPELNYIQKGAQVQGGAGSGGATLKLDYIEVPLLAKVQTPSPGPISPNLFLANSCP